jgi:predicted MFS family arabinose efflux permease
MAHRRLRPGYFVLEGLNAFATAYYFNYLFFFMAARFGFGDLQNLTLAGLSGFVYMGAAWFGGRFGQRRGYFLALRLGIGIMIVALVASTLVEGAAGHFVAMACWTFGMCFTWPTLEALVSECDGPDTLPRRIGIYNLVWAASSALAYFSGGALLEELGLKSVFLVPIVLHVAQLALIFKPPRREAGPTDQPVRTGAAPASVAWPVRPSPERARHFLRLAWRAVPFAYVAINTIIAVIPALAKRHGLSPMWAGFFCSVWFFARMGAFLVLWLWPGWHYRFRWFLSAYLLLIASFLTLLLARRLGAIILAQVVLGGACGLLYYSSLFYSMDVGETKGDHGGIHETAIGAGIFAGPALGAAGLYLLPDRVNAGTWAVTSLLLVGLGVLVVTRLRGRS